MVDARWAFLASVLSLASAGGCDCGSDGPGDSSDDGGTDGDGATEADGGNRGDGGTGSLVLDETFGEDGLVRVQSTGTTDWIWAASLTADGHIFAGGGTTNGLGRRYEALVARFDTADGSLDANWGVEGIALLSFHDGGTITSIAALDDGGALAVGYSTFGRQRLAFVTRLDAQGAVDESFGTGGVTSWESEGSGSHLIALADDGSSYAFTPSAAASRPELRHLTPSGAIDESFGEAGVLTVLGEQPRELTILEDGSLLALAGIQFSDSFLTRVTGAGVVDTDYGEDGTVRIQFDAYALALDPSADDLVVVGGTPPIVLKLDRDGLPVADFGTNGQLEVGGSQELVDVKWLPSTGLWILEGDVVNFPAASPIAVHHLQPDGAELPFASDAIEPRRSYLSHLLATDSTVYLVGTELEALSAEAEATVLALDSTGAVVGGFGTNGVARAASTATSEILWDMTRRSDGSIVAVGPAFLSGLAVRFVDGAQDLGFGEGGFVDTNPIGGLLLRVSADEDDRVVGASAATLMRLLPDGSPDPAFGDGGKSTVALANADIHAVATDAEGRVVGAGEVIAGRPLVTRMLADGAPDPGFGDGGIVQDFGDLLGSFFGVIPEADGIVLGGGGRTGTLLARVGLDGALDAAFGDAGSTVVDGGPYGFRLLPRLGGGYLIGGFATGCPDDDCPVSVVAFDDGGAVDASFGAGGTTTVDGRSYGGLLGMAQLTDGSILVGASVEGDLIEQLAVWRFSPNGTLDDEFGDHGVFVMPGRGRAFAVLPDGDGALVAGTDSHPRTGTDGILLRLRANR